MKKNRNIKGFSILELLICILVIVVLISISFPSFKIARSYSRDIICRNNERQICIAYLDYVQNQGYYYDTASRDQNIIITQQDKDILNVGEDVWFCLEDKKKHHAEAVLEPIGYWIF